MADVRRDYYEVLGVSRDADTAAIKAKFRELAREYHPDRNKAPDAEARFKEVAEAYAVLSDPDKRKHYDAKGFAGVEGLSQEDLYGGIDFGDLFGGFDFGFGRSGLFDGLFGRRRRAGPPRGADIETLAAVTLDQILHGGKHTVRVLRPKACSECGGSGAKPGTTAKPCTGCGGSGKRTSQSKRGNVLFQSVATCELCHGRGEIIEQPCPTCSGRGSVEHEDHLEVRIPKGAYDGLVLRVAGHGLPSPESNGSPGDLLVVLETLPDPRFERRGRDLVRAETLTVAEAALGTTLEVETPDGRATVTVPPGTQPGTLLSLRGKGLPDLEGSERGDLLLALGIEVPRSLSPEQRKLFESLRALDAPRRRS